jgi:hypothetical protein
MAESFAVDDLIDPAQTSGLLADWLGAVMTGPLPRHGPVQPW